MMIYVFCYDNYIFWDWLVLFCFDDSEEECIKMYKFVLVMVLIFQGMVFLYVGMEFLCIKDGVENFFEFLDSINQMDWLCKVQYVGVNGYVKGFIVLCKVYLVFWMWIMVEVKKYLAFLDIGESSNLIVYQIVDGVNGDDWFNIVVVFNGNEDYQSVNILEGVWIIVVDGGQVSLEGFGIIEGGVLQILGRIVMVFYQ